ncbi:metal ABC transporter substrate-binding protein [Herbiconiux sp. CPCC 203407]|uniref:Metal ABC transporter substrate-binding protein n=1 Tax=Herbiconiux oxytropis TaxID=2970915 RepID=A0AA41XBK3_9MICO|nr:metal ABC transporter substrate-binding protein [Herbiconiux oxytropis]MCS5723016.1 metal ABC transporter substrate-binding protein [Herbiconiux oxytropis]MCS5725172.1 metal ABC transporter substrate-binding protein [Herbiconiux oxytropis]
MKKKTLVLPVLLSSTALALAGCASGGGATGATAAAGEQLQVVATTTQVADFTRQVAGDAATVTQLIQPNQSAHSYDPSAADLAALGSADVLVINGAGLEEWLDDAISASGFSGTTIDASTGIELSSDEAGDGHEHADDETHTDEAHADEAHAEDEHAHEGGNPHIWTDPHRAEQMVATIETGLAEADSAAADDFEANATAYEAKLAELDEWIHTNVDTVPEADRLLVSNHDAFTYFVDAYGITYVGSVIPSFDDNAEPSAAEIDELVAAIKVTGVKAVFSEASISPKAADTIAAEAGVTVYSGEEALYGDSLGPEGSDGATYLASQIHNATVILESWGVTPSAVPRDLED